MDRDIPAAAGVGLRLAHLSRFAGDDGARPAASWLEIHSETFLCDGGPRRAMLTAARERYPLSCHGVGLSLGSAEGLDPAHLRRLKTLFASVDPGLVSEHLAWSVRDGRYFNDLLPLPYTAESLDIFCRNVDTAQQAFGRRILVENPSAYVGFVDSTMSETTFLNGLVARTECGLLLDVNNVYVTCGNMGGDPAAYLAEIDADAVGEIHLAGHTLRGTGAAAVRVDTHSRPVCAAVWELYRATIARMGPRPTLIEWDLELPPLETLLAESAKAQAILDGDAPVPRAA